MGDKGISFGNQQIKTNDATSMRARHGVLLSEPKNGVGIRPAVAKCVGRIKSAAFLREKLD
jgi:hypothetical protein